jgi:cell division protein FtsW
MGEQPKEVGNGMLKKIAKCDQVVLLIVTALTCCGVVMVFSASAVMADKRYGDAFYFLKRQGGFAAVGMVVMFVVMGIDYHVWKKLAGWALLCSLLLLVVVLVPGLGGSAGGASRWIALPAGFRFQPSEMAKIALILFMAYSLEKKGERVRALGAGFVSYMIVLVLLLLLLLKQPDLGTAVTLFLVAFAMLFVAGVRLSYIVSVILLSLPFLYYLVAGVAYRRRRFMAFLDPWQDPRNSGFQIIQSWLALGSGGLFGQGLGAGKQKLFYLPEAHTDFILAVIGEELGFVGVTVIISLFAVLVQRTLCIAMAARDTFGRFLALGIGVLVGIEAVFNIGVVTGLFPTKGLALPFVSYGGSSLVVSLFAMGVLLSISSETNDRKRDGE